jgi:xanthine dehydrogenase accessory factor
MKNIYQECLNLLSLRDNIALSTVVTSTGSTPQKAGSSAIIGPEGIIAGTIGGGRVEGEIIRMFRQSRNSGYHQFNLNSDISNNDESICGGRMDILIDSNPAVHHNTFEDLSASLKQGIPGILTTQIIFTDDGSITIDRKWSAGKNDNFHLKKEKKSLIFQEPVLPPEHLIIAGAGHIGKALSHIANFLGFEVTVLDNRPEFANKFTLPDADHVIAGEMEEIMKSIPKNSSSYFVIATQGHSNDAIALRNCLGSDAAYIGMIGSKRKIELMREKFINNNWATSRQWDSVHAPVGLNIGSQTVQEIAVSIAAELVLIRNSKRK